MGPHLPARGELQVLTGSQVRSTHGPPRLRRASFCLDTGLPAKPRPGAEPHPPPEMAWCTRMRANERFATAARSPRGLRPGRLNRRPRGEPGQRERTAFPCKRLLPCAGRRESPWLPAAAERPPAKSCSYRTALAVPPPCEPSRRSKADIAVKRLPAAGPGPARTLAAPPHRRGPAHAETKKATATCRGLLLRSGRRAQPALAKNAE